MHFIRITNLDLHNKKVFIRTDMNVPLRAGLISDDTRIKAAVGSIKYALQQGAKVIVATHLGRPIEGMVRQEDQVEPIAKRLGELLGLPVPVTSTWLSSGLDFSLSPVIMLENVRCNRGEKDNSKDLGMQYASLCDIFCYDAFATAHRAEASTNAIGYAAATVCAGLLMAQELDALTTALANPKRPVVAIVGGAKVSTKLSILANLATKVDVLIVGGGILNTFLLARGEEVGASLVEADLVATAQQIMEKMAERGATIPLPQDIAVASALNANAPAIIKQVQQIAANEMILDIGPRFAQQLSQILLQAGTIIWNGPMGVFELEQFSLGTKVVAQAIARSEAFSLAGGGDTIAALNKFKIYPQINYVSTAGGALLEFLEGKELPAIKLLTFKRN
jgi:phosphoglycerate kinase